MILPCDNPVRILVVEDDEAIRGTLRDILELNGHTVEVAEDGLVGVHKARLLQPDLILADIAMPRMDGLAMIEALQEDERTRAIPVIIVSASVELERMRAGMDRGAADYIIKPFTEEQVLRSIKARLEKKALLDDLDAFAHTVAHDLKNPIAELYARTTLLRMRWSEDSEERKLAQLKDLELGVRRLGGIVDELLLFAGARRMAVEACPVDMGTAVHAALERFGHEIATSGAQIHQPGEWPEALAHAPWVTEIWANYLSNALKYGGRPPVIRLGAERETARGGVRFWVQDNGPGISAELQPRLFRQYSRGATAAISGQGLGLSIVRRLAEKLRGRVGAENLPEGGCRFWFELPEVERPDSPTSP